jgi:hypothetical protein
MSISNGVDFSRTYEMDHAFRPGVFHFEVISVIGNSEAILKGGEQPLGELEFRAMKGSRPADVMGTTLLSLRLVSQRFADLLLDNRFTGWHTHPVNLYDKKGNSIEGYQCLVVTGRAGPIDRSRSHIRLDPPPVPQGAPTYVEVGMYYDPDSWDGSDIFIPQSTTAICVAERVKDAVEKAGLTNVQFTALSDFQGNRFSELPPGRELTLP